MMIANLYSRLQKQLRDSSDPSTLVQRLLELCSGNLHSSVGFIYLYDPEAESLIFHIGHNCSLLDIERSVLPLTDSASGRVVHSKQLADFTNIQTEGTYVCKDFAKRHSLERYIAYPLLDSHNSVIGVLGLHPPARHIVNRTQRQILSTVCRIIALALEALRARQRETQLLQLSKLGNMLTARGNLRTIDSALEQVRSSVSAEQVYYFEERKEIKHFAPKAPVDAPQISPNQIRRLALQNLETKLPVSESLEGSPRDALPVQVFLTACPVEVQSKPHGFLAFVNTSRSISLAVIPSLSKDRGLIELAANLFAVFLENLRYLESLKQEEERRHTLTLSLSHEFIIPLTGIAARVDKLKKTCTPFFEERARNSPPFIYFKDIHYALEDLQELTTGILSLTEEVCNFRPCFIFGPIFLRVVDLLKHQALQRGNEIIFDQQEFVESFPRIAVDKTLVTHVFYNVIKNAVKYSYKKTPIRVRAWSNSAWRCVSIENWGIGVPAGEVDSIFEPFRQGSNAHTASARGAGIGLHICRRIMELHSGEIILQNYRDPTSFIIRFPAQERGRLEQSGNR